MKAETSVKTIGIVAPGSYPSLEIMENTKAYLAERGFLTKEFGISPENNHRTHSGDILRAKALEEAFTDETVDAVLCARGGYGCSRLLDIIDYSLIAKNQKPFIGYSDVTGLLFSLTNLAGIQCLHGPMASDISNGLDSDSKQTFLDSLVDYSASYEFNSNIASPINCGKAKGKLIGGNLTVLCSLIGTKGFNVPNNAILFIEEVSEFMYQIDRNLTHLKRVGIFDKISGIIVGKSVIKDPGENNSLGLSFEEMLKDQFKDFHGPVTSGIPIGHTEHQVTLPFSVPAELIVTKSKTCINF